MNASDTTAKTRVITLLTSSVVTMTIGLSGCSFKEDRKDIIVPIVDASPATAFSKPQRPQETNKTESTATYTYTVRSGDTLGIIAQKYLGASSRYTELLELNKLDPNDAIYVGQKLKLPTEGLTVPEKDTAITTQTSLAKAESPKQQYPELDSLMESGQYNQAIQWCLSNERLKTDSILQQKLLEAAKSQVSIYTRQQKTADAETLLSGLINQANINPNNKKILEQELLTLKANRNLVLAKQYADKSKFNESYNILLEAWNKVGKTLEDNVLFTTTRNKVTENYHQNALKHYRNQELDEALVYWNKILAINPNDDLALVYKDRVKALKNKLQNL